MIAFAVLLGTSLIASDTWAAILLTNGLVKID